MKINTWEGFSKLDFKLRVRKLIEQNIFQEEDIDLFSTGALSPSLAEHLVENVIGIYALPYSVAPHFLIDGKECVIPLVTEETSVVAALSYAGKLIAENGGFQTKVIGHVGIGQIQFPFIHDERTFEKKIVDAKLKLIESAQHFMPQLTARGGGLSDIVVRFLKRPDGKTMAVLHLLCDTRDAMGANIINQICEHLKPEIESITREKIGLCILSNLVDTKLVEAQCSLSTEPILGRKIEEANLFAELDPYRAATHNKGIMNGIDALLLATGNDFRAVEAGAHAYASLGGRYQALTTWKFTNNKLEGKLTLPIACGTVGGVTKTHPLAQLSLKILKIQNSGELARVCAAIGLAQNFSALRALSEEGIIKGHMKLHASNLALVAGAQTENEIKWVCEKLYNAPLKTVVEAQKLLSHFRNQEARGELCS